MTSSSSGRNSLGATLVLAHGAGAPMDSPFMTAIAGELEAIGVSVKRFEFAYMAARRVTGKRAPPPRAEKLTGEFEDAIAGIDSETIFIGGKSLGGRVASMISQEQFEAGRIRGLVCLGYPFHPPGKPERLRTAHLSAMTCPALLVQGENDPLGKRVEVEGYDLPASFQLAWIPQANHDLVPLKRTGVSIERARRLISSQIKTFISINIHL